jgi:hypothetical protein
MKQTINLKKTNFNKEQYPRVINTQFTQLVSVSQSLAQVPTPTVNEFFSLYSQLFYDIPERGTTNSHEYLIKTSTAYIGLEDIRPEIEALQAEITSLREQLLESQQEIADLIQTSNGG